MEFKKLYVPDSEEVRELLDSVWEGTYVDCLTPEAMKTFSQNWGILKELSSEEEQNVAVIAAFEGKEIVGIAISRKTDDETAEIKRLYVLPDHQGQGIGRRLLTDTLIAFSEVVDVSLWVEEQNNIAISFYEKFNFQQKETVEKEKNGVPLRLILMEISLE